MSPKVTSKRTAPQASDTNVTETTDSSTPLPPATLADACDGYLKAIEDAGASTTTLRGYRAELRMAMDELGSATALAELTAERIGAYFEGERVTHTRSGDEASPLSVAKRRRVLRPALQWSVEAGLISEAPLPQ